MKAPRRCWLWSIVACGLIGVTGGRAFAQKSDLLPRRWLYLQQNLQVTANVDKIEPILRRAAKVGYNGVVLADYKLNILDRVPEHYFQNADRFQALCRELKLEIIPAVMPFGYSDGILAHDPNLAEGLPAREVPMRVQGSSVVLDSDVTSLIAGDFEEPRGDKFVGWNSQDEPGSGTFADAAVKHGGSTSLRIANPPKLRGNRRVSKLLKVRPWSQFHASVWVKTTDFESAGDLRMFALGSTGRVLSHSNLGVKQTQEWTQHHVVFNSLENSEVRFYVGAWDCGAGQAWIDDAKLVEEPFVNLVRRPGCPLVVTDDSGQMVFIEGQDFEPLHDAKLGVTPWAGQFDVYHEPPVLKLTPDSRIQDGRKLRVSFFHAITIYDLQVPCSLTEPKVFEIVEDQVRRVQKLFKPDTYFLSHDEIRVANWSETDVKSNKSAGQQLAENIQRCVAIVRKISPEAKLCVWNDMFDPHHNAVKDFYLVNGDLTGSWDGLPKDMLIVNWNNTKRTESLKFFSGRGHSQIAAGFYDAGPETARHWNEAARGSNTLQGSMYTTWRSDFSQLERYAEIAWGAK